MMDPRNYNRGRLGGRKCEMRNTTFGVGITLLGGVLLLSMVSCEDQESGSSYYKEFDLQIDSIASAPLPIISPAMANLSLDAPSEPVAGLEEPAEWESESERAPEFISPNPATDNEERIDTYSTVEHAVDPNSI